MTDVNQFVPFEHAQDKGAEIFSAAARFREPRNHGILREPRLHLQPLPAPSARFVDALRIFGDDPFQPLFFGYLVEQDAFFRYVVAESYFRNGRENLFQEFLPPEKRQVCQIMAPEVEEIENIIEQMTASGVLVMLERMEIRASLVVHDDDFAVQDRVKSEFSQCFHNGKELFVERDEVRGIERNVLVPELGNGAVPIPLHLKDPIGMIEWLLGHSREHRYYGRWHRFDRRVLQVLAFHRFVKTDLVSFLLPERFRPVGLEHLFQRFPGHDGTVLLENVPFDRTPVFFLQEKPRLPVLPRFYQREFTVELFPFEDEFHVPFFQPFPKKLLAFALIFRGGMTVKPPVPNDNASRAVITLT